MVHSWMPSSLANLGHLRHPHQALAPLITQPVHLEGRPPHRVSVNLAHQLAPAQAAHLEATPHLLHLSTTMARRDLQALPLRRPSRTKRLQMNRSSRASAMLTRRDLLICLRRKVVAIKVSGARLLRRPDLSTHRMVSPQEQPPLCRKFKRTP